MISRLTEFMNEDVDILVREYLEEELEIDNNDN